MKKNAGTLEVICGPMFSGKTEELIRRVKRALIAKQKVQVFKHEIDKRYGLENKIYSHGGQTFKTVVISNSKEILTRLKKSTDIVAIDEAQWFGKELIDVIIKLLRLRKTVIISGLALTFDRQPFEPIPTLMAMAEKVIKLSAVCVICGDNAIYHKRMLKKTNIDPLTITPLFLGKTDTFQARCRNCFEK